MAITRHATQNNIILILPVPAVAGSCLRCSWTARVVVYRNGTWLLVDWGTLTTTVVPAAAAEVGRSLGGGAVSGATVVERFDSTSQGGIPVSIGGLLLRCARVEDVAGGAMWEEYGTGGVVMLEVYMTGAGGAIVLEVCMTGAGGATMLVVYRAGTGAMDVYMTG
jgi:hypothetical protein